MFSKDASLISCTDGHCYTYSEPPLQELSNDVQIYPQISKMQKNIFSSWVLKLSRFWRQAKNPADILGRS